MTARPKKQIDIIIDAILANDLSNVPKLLENNFVVYLDKCISRDPPIETLPEIIKTIYGHEKLTNEEIHNIAPIRLLRRNFSYFMKENNMLTFIKIFYPPDYTLFNHQDLQAITKLMVMFKRRYYGSDHQPKLLKFLQYYTAQFRKQLK